MGDTEKAPATREPGDLFTRWLGDVAWPRWAGFRTMEPWSRFEHLPRVEEYREGGEFVVRAEMPGLDPDKDVELQVTDHTLRIRAERKEEQKTQEKGHYRSEFRYGSFSRMVELPSGATADDVKASYKDGILEVRIPVDAGKAETTKVPIQRV
jgi:HSP20 family protein